MQIPSLDSSVEKPHRFPKKTAIHKNFLEFFFSKFTEPTAAGWGPGPLEIQITKRISQETQGLKWKPSHIPLGPSPES